MAWVEVIMRTTLLTLTLLATACGLGPTDPYAAPELEDATTQSRSLADVYARTSRLHADIVRLKGELAALTEETASLSGALDGHVTVLKAAITDVHDEVGELSKVVDGHVTVLKAAITDVQDDVDAASLAVDGHVTVLKAATTDLAEGTCAVTRERGSGMATGRRTYQPLVIHHGNHVHGDPHVDTRDGVLFQSSPSVVVVDADHDGTPEYIALEVDLDGDGLSEQIELGGDRDRDGDLDDDAYESSVADEKATGQLCGATSHF